MAEAVPKIRVTDPQSRETNGFEKQDRMSKGDGMLSHKLPHRAAACMLESTAVC